MALKRLDEEFELRPGTQLLPYMKRLLPSLEGRFQSIEGKQSTVEGTIEDVRAVALARINEILIPATEDIVAVTTLGFLLGPSHSSALLELATKTFIIDPGPQRESFTPSPYVIIEHSLDANNYALARVVDYDRETGGLTMTITAHHGNPGPHSNWVISSTPGMAHSTQQYYEAVAPMHAEVEADRAEVAIARDEVIAAAQALAAAGLDAQAFIRRDGTVPFVAVQRGVSPPAGQNDTIIATTQWTRQRIQEYIATTVPIAGNVTMQGPLNLIRNPINTMEAATKAYVDAALGYGGTMTGNLTIQTVNPMLIMRASGAGQYRSIHSQASNTAARWHLMVGDNAAETGGNAGSDFAVHRYADGGAYLGTPLQINRANGSMAYTGNVGFYGYFGTNGGNVDHANGDLGTYRSAAAGGTNTGVLFMNAARSAYHHWDGATHYFAGGGISCGGSPLNTGHINCYSIYTQGHGATFWGGTSHGNFHINGMLYTNSNIRIGGGINHSTIEMYDNDWGPMYIHHNNDLIGFLNNGSGWIHYITNAGHMWTAQYGWLHDYVNNRAWDIAWYTANTKANEAFNTYFRDAALHYAGDANWSWGAGRDYEPWLGAVQTGWYQDGYMTYHNHRMRWLQYVIDHQWITIRAP